MKRCRKTLSRDQRGIITFSATARRKCSSLARYTTAIPPVPIRSSTVYPATRVPGSRDPAGVSPLNSSPAG